MKSLRLTGVGLFISYNSRDREMSKKTDGGEREFSTLDIAEFSIIIRNI